MNQSAMFTFLVVLALGAGTAIAADKMGDMRRMDMSFVVKDKALLDVLAVGKKAEFEGVRCYGREVGGRPPQASPQGRQENDIA